ncbi:MAG: hypothetical protein R2729_19870 [Bryobacteraceae bacterium]
MRQLCSSAVRRNGAAPVAGPAGAAWVAALMLFAGAHGPGLKAADQMLKISVTEGEGAFHDTKRRLGYDIGVEVKNERGEPVANAEVTFILPTFGASGSYDNGSQTYKTSTDAQGRARSLGFKPNAIDGRFTVKITAAAEGRQGQTTVSQINSGAVKAVTQSTGSGGGKSKLILGLAGTGATVALLVSRLAGGGNGGSSNPSRPPTTLSVGGISVGGPR